MNANTGEPSPITITFDLQLRDVEHGLAALPRARWARRAAWVSIAVVAALVAWRVREGRDPGVMLAIGAFLVVVLFIGRDPAKRVAKRVYAALPEAARHVELRFDAHGILATSGDAATETPWSRVSQVLEDQNSLLLFESSSNAQIVPRRSLTEEQSARLQELIRLHVVPHRQRWLTRQIALRLVIYLVLFAAFWFFYKHR
jgi:hypothetical protein